MPKQPLSVTLDRDNLLWLRGRVAIGKQKSLSEALDDILTAARLGGDSSDARSVVGTIDIAADDAALEHADEYIRTEVSASLARQLLVREARPTLRHVKPKTGRG